MATAHQGLDYQILPGDPSFVAMPSRDFSLLLRRVQMTESDLQLSPQFIKDENRKCLHTVILRDDFESLDYGLNAPDPDDLFQFECPQKSVRAKAVIDRSEEALFVIRGSEMAIDAAASLERPYIYIRRRLETDRVVERTSSLHDKPVYEFTRDWFFGSPSEAARVIAGYPVDGLIAWIDKKSGKSLRELGIRWTKRPRR